jgi:predicted DNA-binding transcriptional regulator AlpA
MADTLPIEPILVNAEQAARLLGISRSAFYSKLSAGLIIPPVYIGESPRWSIEELTDWIRHGAPAAEQWLQIKGTK